VRALSRDDGATAIIIAIFMSTFLIGMSALTIDVGSLFTQRRELQNGADAGALAVAKSCMDGTCDTTKATTYSTANDHDGTSQLDASAGAGVCGTFAGLPSCTDISLPALSQVYDCAEPLPSSSINYVQVRTESAPTSTLTPGFLARALLGNSGYSGTTVHACARAAVLPATGGGGLAATISLCEWQAMTDNGNNFAPAPPYPPNPTTSVEVNLQLHDGQSSATNYPCPTGYGAGADLPGGFGWLDDPTSTCTTTVDTSGTYGASTGVAISGPCKTLLDAAITAHGVLYIPVYDHVLSGNGQNGAYQLSGFAAFVPTGYNLPGSGTPPKRQLWLTSQFCYTPLNLTPQDKCLSGFFTQGLVPAATFDGSGGSLPGADVLSLIQ
jgi:hypothetical protein